MKKILFVFLILVFSLLAKATITTPYPTTITLKQINGAEKERIRLCQGHKKYDKQPTGFYIEAGKTIVVNVEILTPADDNVMPQLTVGTLGFNVDDRNTGTTTTLKKGVNTIANNPGGLIWLSFTTNASADPKGIAQITFTDASEQVRVPRFIYGTTTNTEFKEMLTDYATPDVLYQSDYVVVVATKEAANTYSKDNNKVTWLNAIHTLLELEDGISGLNNEDENPIHHRLNAGEIRFLLVQNTFASPHANSAGYTGYPSGSISRYLTEIGTPTNNTWMLGHEIGHQHQQPAYQINMSTESTVNIYSYVVERNIQGEGYNRTSAERWATARATYLQLPFSKRVYDMDTDELEAIVGFNRDELRFMVWEQLFLNFGDDFYKRLHRVVREEKISSGGTADERRAYLIWKASQVTGYDLTEFFNIWGIRVTDSIVKADLRAKIAYGKSTSAILDLSDIGRTPEELSKVTGQNRPDWAPIALRGITSSTSTIPEVFDRTDWTIVTSYQGVSDATVGGDQPEYIIDESTTTAFAFVKPGKSYGGVTIPSESIPSFTVDMKSVNTFNYISYTHRLGNTSEYIRARQLSIYGSNDGVEFTALKEHQVIDYTINANEVLVEFPAASYRYVKVVIEDWNKDSGSTMQVSDFKVGTEVIEEKLPVPDPLQFRVNVTADDGVITSQAGTNMADEDSQYTLNFTLAAGKNTVKVTVDGDEVVPMLNDGVYTLKVKVTNHIAINIASSYTDTAVPEHFSENSISIYPNPVKAGEAISLHFNNDAVGALVKVYSVSGIEVMTSQAVSDHTTLNISQPGLYIVKVSKNNKTSNFKVVVD